MVSRLFPYLSGDFDLRGAQHRAIVSGYGQERQVDRAHSPAVMLEHADEWWRAGDVSHEADCRRIEIVGNRDALFLGSFDDRRYRQIVAQRLATAAVDIADGGTDLGVAVAVDFLFEKIDQAPVALEDREDAEIRARRGFREERLDPRREIEIRKDPPKGPKGQSDSVQD